jgi:hypothetical protein
MRYLRERILWMGIAGSESGETSSRAIATDSRRKLDAPSPAKSSPMDEYAKQTALPPPFNDALECRSFADGTHRKEQAERLVGTRIVRYCG